MPPSDEYCLLWIQWWPLCMTKGEWSGWMQAIGTVFAIFAAMQIARWQDRRAANTARALAWEGLRARVGSIADLMSWTASQIHVAGSDLQRDPYDEKIYREIETRMEIVAALNLNDVEPAEVRPYLLTARNALAEQHRAYLHLAARKRSGTYRDPSSQDHKVALQVQRTAAVRALNQLAEVLDSLAPWTPAPLWKRVRWLWK